MGGGGCYNTKLRGRERKKEGEIVKWQGRTKIGILRKEESGNEREEEKIKWAKDGQQYERQVLFLFLYNESSSLCCCFGSTEVYRTCHGSGACNVLNSVCSNSIYKDEIDPRERGR